MYRSSVLVCMILISATLGFSQGPPADHDDHDDAAPVRSGYAVVTPLAATTSGTTSGLVVFETFGLRSSAPNADATQAGELPADLTTNALLFVDSSGRLSKNLGVAIVNPNNSNANVTLTLRKNDGTQLATTNMNILPYQQTSQFVTQMFSGQPIPSDVTGTLAITSAGSSNLPVGVVGLRFRGSNFSTIPITNLSSAPVPSITTTTGTGTATIGGSGSVLLPQFAANGGWATELVLINSGTSGLTVRVDLFKQDGTPLSTALNGQTNSSFTNISIPAGGVVVLAPRNGKGDDDF
jgi:hypothetical protein